MQPDWGLPSPLPLFLSAPCPVQCDRWVLRPHARILFWDVDQKIKKGKVSAGSQQGFVLCHLFYLLLELLWYGAHAAGCGCKVLFV